LSYRNKCILSDSCDEQDLHDTQDSHVVYDPYLSYDSYEGRDSFEEHGSPMGKKLNTRSDGKLQKQRQSNSNAGKKCYHCGCMGHMAKDCPMKKEGLDAVCFECNGTGHKAAQCPMKPKSDQKIFVKQSFPQATLQDFPSSDVNFRDHYLGAETKPSTTSIPLVKPVLKVNRKDVSRVCKRSAEPMKHDSGLLYPPGFTTCDHPTENHLTHISSPNPIRNQYRNGKTDCSAHEVDSNTSSAFLTRESRDKRVHLYESIVGKEQFEVQEKVVAFTKKMVDLNSEYTEQKCNQAYKISSHTDALSKVLLLTSKTEVIKMSPENSHGYHLAKDTHVTVYSHTLQSSAFDETTTICTDAQGDVVIQKGKQIGFDDIAQILSAEITEVDVYTKPKIAILSVGEDLINWNSSNRTQCKVIDSNGPVIDSMIRECGGEIVARKLINDGRKMEEEILRSSKICDMLVLCGGSRVLN